MASGMGLAVDPVAGMHRIGTVPAWSVAAQAAGLGLSRSCWWRGGCWGW